MIESYGLNDQPACIQLHINGRANRQSPEIGGNHVITQCLGVQINTPSSQSRTRDRLAFIQRTIPGSDYH
jgi:hypothetical protein